MELRRKYLIFSTIIIIFLIIYLNKKTNSKKNSFRDWSILNNDALNNEVKQIEPNDESKLQEVKLKPSTEVLVNNLQLDDIKEHMRIYDLKAKNDKNFNCVKSANIIVQTTICIHDIGRDIYVSGAIQSNGVWEWDLVDLFMRMVNSRSDINVFDIGAQLGQYTLFAAKLGRKCIAVEPFYDSYIRLHKSVQLENLQDNVILLTNGLSDKRGEMKKLLDVPSNVGGQTLLNDPSDYSAKKNESDIKNNPYIIETILMDDIIQVLPKDFKDCVMKIDIEGYEGKAFLQASKLFSRVNVLAVFMEWAGKVNNQFIKEEETVELVKFFQSRNYEVKSPRGLSVLSYDDWRSWPGDIILVQKGFNF